MCTASCRNISKGKYMSLFISALGPSLETFLKFKNSIGIQYNASAQWCLKSLDRYNFKHGNSTVLCKSLVVGWSIERSEHSNSKCGPWISPVREFGRYLRSMGDLDAYVLEYPVSQNSFRPEVYLLSDIEIQRFLKNVTHTCSERKHQGVLMFIRPCTVFSIAAVRGVVKPDISVVKMSTLVTVIWISYNQKDIETVGYFIG